MLNTLGQILPIAAERFGDKTALIIDDVTLSLTNLKNDQTSWPMRFFIGRRDRRQGNTLKHFVSEGLTGLE